MLESIEKQIWHWATVQPDKIAVKSGKKSATYLQLCQRILGARDYFKSQLSQNEGNVVILAAGKQIEFVYAYFGAHLAGLKVVPIDAATNPPRLDYIVKQTHANLLVGFDESEQEVAKARLKDFAELSADFSTGCTVAGLVRSDQLSAGLLRLLVIAPSSKLITKNKIARIAVLFVKKLPEPDDISLLCNNPAV